MGGYCQLEGENGESESPRSFGKKSKLKRFIILAAGAVMNLILGFIVVITMNLTTPTDYYPSTVIQSVTEGTPAYEMGIREGDKIIGLNGDKVNFYMDFNIYNDSPDLDLVLLRGNEKIKVNVTPKSYLVDKSGEIVKESNEEGAKKLVGIKFGTEKKGFLSTLKYSFFESVLIGKLIVISIGDLITGAIPANNLSGPIGIVGVINTAAKSGLTDILYIMAFITINLGVFNLMPLPALDGGRIVFIVIEAIIRKPVPPKYEGIIHAAGFLLLILLMLYATGNDFVRLFSKG
jgi:regulator of sigma E protease